MANLLHLNRLVVARGSTHRFTEFFRGFEKVEAVREIFGERTEEVLQNLKVELLWINGYMWVNDANGHLMVSSRYLNEGNRVHVYLDVIHELVHVKQFMNGRELFDDRYSYVERPTEIEAYRCTVEEARRIGMNDEKILEYLRTEWMADEDLEKLARTLGVKSGFGKSGLQKEEASEDHNGEKTVVAFP